MPSRQSVPRIRVDFLDSPPCNLSPSSTLDIRDILSQVKLLPKLLAENFVLDDADDVLYLEDNDLQDVLPFPTGRRPPLFILNSHRTRLPFPIRPEAFELDDLCWNEEDAYPLLTAPTIPRMKLVIKEQLYVQKWVDTLTSENPPRHIPWTCERPATEKKWIAEGSIFPAAVVKSCNDQQHLRVIDTNRSPALADHVPYSGELCASAPIHLSTESHVKSADADPGIIRGESKISQTPRRIVRAPQAPSPPTLLPSAPPIQTTSTTPDVPLAARRGKSLSGLKVKGSVIEQLEYPDIPTAFRGSPGVWSPGFDTFHVPSLTDHRSMLLDLRSKCAALGNGVSTYIQEPLYPQTEMTRTPPSADEWTFAQGLATFDNNLSGSIDTQVPWEIVADTSIFLPDDSSTPAKSPSFTARLGFAPRFHSMLALQSPVSRPSNPPADPLPPRPALISPSTPPSVRGILKKAKSVRFEDMITLESQSHTSPVVSPPQAPPERPPPPSSAISSERPCTPMPHTSSAPAPVREMPVLGKNVQEKKPAPRSRLPPKRTKANRKLESTQPSAGKTPETSKPSSATTSIERPRRTAHVKENTNAVAVPQAQAKQKGLSITETDVRRGIEGTTKSRLSTPLRNIFRFR
ncbi:hypothetical protein J3R82DRAFT_2476 [Butyriboletus roseoflavus]|nr:hypothetical protein J3R82DRAFT_2476 [Butyriboletus roseoflavus]